MYIIGGEIYEDEYDELSFALQEKMQLQTVIVV